MTSSPHQYLAVDGSIAESLDIRMDAEVAEAAEEEEEEEESAAVLGLPLRKTPKIRRRPPAVFGFELMEADAAALLAPPDKRERRRRRGKREKKEM